MDKERLLARRRRQTLEAIDRNPSMVSLVRSQKTGDGIGGTHKTGTETLPAQKFRLYLSHRYASKDVNKEGGQGQLTSFELLGPWNADIKNGDSFTVDSRKFRVEGVVPVMAHGEVVSLQCAVLEVV